MKQVTVSNLHVALDRLKGEVANLCTMNWHGRGILKSDHTHCPTPLPKTIIEMTPLLTETLTKVAITLSKKAMELSVQDGCACALGKSGDDSFDP